MRRSEEANRTWQELPAEIAEYHPPESSKQTCVDWAAFTNVDVVDQIDSGL